MFISWKRQLPKPDRKEIPLTVIGNGSNLLVKDKGIRGVVVKLGNTIKNVVCQDDKIIAEAEFLWRLLLIKLRLALLQGGFAVGIPGSIGGSFYECRCLRR